jgi:chemotaxis protein methyltransferase CheR
MRTVTAAAAAGPGVAVGGAGFDRLRRIVRERTGLDLAPYKDRFLERRLAIRLRATGHASLEEYVGHLASAEGEVDNLMHCLTIHVSTFFRNASTLAAIREAVLPEIFARGGARRSVRFWSVGCARGEEPYSLAILVLEHLGAERRHWDVQIHGIDVDDRVLEEAKAASFTPHQIGDLDAALRDRWFTREGARWSLVPEARRLVRFHRRDILMEPPGTDYDFILCRNLLIYLDRGAQEAVLERFGAALRPGGFLVLGRTEIFVGAGRAAFEVVDARERIYRRLRERTPVQEGPGAPRLAGAAAVQGGAR